ASLLRRSYQIYEQELTPLTAKSYRFANSMQTSQRKIPFVGGSGGVGTNYHWTQLAPLYEKELNDFEVRAKDLRRSQIQTSTEKPATREPFPAATFKLIGTNAETYEVKVGASPFTDRRYTIQKLAPELNGLTGIRFSHDNAKSGRYVPVEFEVSEPV